IIIGEYEAQSIALGLENIMPPRPITHDLLLNMLETLDAKIERVIISDLRSNTYYAIIQVRSQARMYDIDARPSDAIALAVRQNIQIFIEEEVMRKGAYDAKEVEDLGERQIDTHQEQLDRLKKELDEAVEKEEYEKAAKLRDHIKKLESRQ
ncbi:MAG: bifunctional nuclease family protein, partial [Calditrichaeota bacterium]|nr:bifunctional nuclease family protein [Calditrichota bacterium]